MCGVSVKHHTTFQFDGFTVRPSEPVHWRHKDRIEAPIVSFFRLCQFYGRFYSSHSGISSLAPASLSHTRSLSLRFLSTNLLLNKNLIRWIKWARIALMLLHGASRHTQISPIHLLSIQWFRLFSILSRIFLHCLLLIRISSLGADHTFLMRLRPRKVQIKCVPWFKCTPHTHSYTQDGPKIKCEAHVLRERNTQPMSDRKCSAKFSCLAAFNSGAQTTGN